MTIDNFIEELKKLNIDISQKQLNQLDRYYNLLVEWNNKINLTSIIDKESVYLKHFYDSLTLSKIIDFNKVSNFCDVGTGAGFPGIVIKILFPNLNVILIDSLNKRINFLNLVISQLGLQKIKTVSSRIEDYAKEKREIYDVVTARAVASLPILLECSIPLVKQDGYFIAMKGDIKSELINIEKCEKELDIELVKKIEFTLPIENSNRTLLKYRKKKATNMKYPRRYSEIKKRPL